MSVEEVDESILELPTEPEIRARVAAVDEIPGGARQVMKLAGSLDLAASATYSRGPWMHSTRWVPTRTADCVVVRVGDGQPCQNCIVGDEDPRAWCDCLHGESPCRGSCRQKAHDQPLCPTAGRLVAVATYLDGKFEHAYWVNPREKVKANDLKARLKAWATNHRATSSRPQTAESSSRSTPTEPSTAA